MQKTGTVYVILVGFLPVNLKINFINQKQKEVLQIQKNSKSFKMGGLKFL